MKMLPLLVGLAVGVSALAAQEPVRQVDTSPRAVLEAASGYLKTYREAMGFVLANEVTLQEVFDEMSRRTTRRETSGEFFLSYAPADGGWLSVRDITRVDGKEVEAGDDLRGLLTQGSMAKIGRAMADRNARFNIGVVTRNFNDPMFAFVILDDKNRSRFKFERQSVTTSGDDTLVTLSFAERDRATIVRGMTGNDVPTRGELTLDAATGRLVRSVIILKDGPTTAQLTTTFTFNESLEMWMPSVMQERYTHSSARTKQTVIAESKYTDYRKFAVTARIK